MRALVLEKANEIKLREIDLPITLGPGDVRIDLKAVGICGSDLHFYQHGGIGPFIVTRPMVLGHEASGVVTEVGAGVNNLKVGDRVCMEPGIPNWNSEISRLGLYNLDPEVEFWATPPVHGVTCSSVVHPANMTFKLPEGMSYQEGAFVEPFAVGVQAATKAGVKPGETALVHGAGTIGLMTAFAALAAGCATVYITDVQQPKLDIAAQYPGIVPINVGQERAVDAVMRLTDGRGVDVTFEASGHPSVFATLFDEIRPGGRVVMIGIHLKKPELDLVAAQVKEISILTVFRYANVYPRAIALLASGKVDVKPLISKTYPFEQAVEAYDFAKQGRPDVVKVQILM